MTGSAPPDLLVTLLAHPDRIDSRQLDTIDVDALLARAEREQVVPLVSRALDTVAPASRVARPVHAAAAAWALRERAECEAIRALLDAADAVPLIFVKGASMAYGVYESPALRMRDDWDVMVAPGAQDAARGALEAAGFSASDAIKPGRIRMRQQSFHRDVPGGCCIVDLHLRAFNPPSLAERVTYADLLACSVPLLSLHPRARGLGLEASLVLACVHRLAHHSAEPRLSWDLDVWRLAAALDASSAPRVADLARRWGAGVFVAQEVARVTARFDVALDPAVTAVLAALGEAAPDGYARPDRSRAREFVLDWRALGWRDRAALVRETLAPDPAFMRASSSTRWPLPMAYLRRIVRGAGGWFTRS